MSLGEIKYWVWWQSRPLNQPSAAMRLRAYIRRNKPRYRVHVGAGLTHLPGWIDTDVAPGCKCWLDITKPWPFPSGSVEAVFSDNVIEHLALPEARRFLRNAIGVMTTEGVFRVVTPDAEGNVRAYLGDSEPHLRAMRDGSKPGEYPVDLIRSAFSLWGHHKGYVYDEHALRSELQHADFEAVKRHEVGKSERAYMAGIDRPSRRGVFYLALEARAPLRIA